MKRALLLLFGCLLAFCLAQSDFWLLNGRLMVDAVSPAKANPELILHRYRFGQKQSQPFKLELEMPHPVADPETVRQIVSLGNERLTLLPLEHHLVIVPKWIPGVWIIPWQRLNTQPWY